MYLDIASDGVVLREPERTTDVYASYWERLSPHGLTTALADADAGELESDGAHVLVPVATLRRLAQGQVPEGWDADFEELLVLLRSRGRLTDDGEAVHTPLERER